LIFQHHEEANEGQSVVVNRRDIEGLLAA